MLPINGPGSPTGALPAPIYCPGLAGPVDARLQKVLDHLPNRICQRTRAQLAYNNTVS